MSNWEIWIDTNISPIMAKWIAEYTNIATKSSYSLNLHSVDDMTIFKMARQKGNVIIMTKDEDFKELIDWFGAPPKAIIIKFGNCSNQIFWEKLKPQINQTLKDLLNVDNIEDVKLIE